MIIKLIDPLISHCSDYYFSSANLTKDVFLRQQMDPEGWLPAALIASFNRMKVGKIDPGGRQGAKKMSQNCRAEK